MDMTSRAKTHTVLWIIFGMNSFLWSALLVVSLKMGNLFCGSNAAPGVCCECSGVIQWMLCMLICQWTQVAYI